MEKTTMVPSKEEKISQIISLFEELSEENKKMLLIYLSIIEGKHKDIIGRLENLEAMIELKEPKEVILIEEMDYDTAKKKVEEFMIKHKTSDIEILHQNLRIPIEQLIDIIDKLINEGKIKEG